MALLTMAGTGVILLGIVLYGYGRSMDMLKGELVARVEGLGDVAASRVMKVPLVVEAVARDLSATLPFIGRDQSVIYPLIESILKGHGELSGLCISFPEEGGDSSLSGFAPFVFRDREEIKRKDLAGEGYKRSEWGWYRLPIELGKPVWTEPYFGTGGSDRIIISHSLPVYGDGGRLLAVLACDVSLDWLADLMEALDPPGGGYAFLLTSGGTILSHVDRDLIMKETIFSLADRRGDESLRSLGKEMQEGKQGLTDFVDFHTGEPGWLFYRPVGDMGWSLGIVFPASALTGPVHDLTRSQFIWGGCGMVLLLLVSMLIARAITGPIRALSSATEILASGDFESPLPEVSGRDEIAQLARSFSSMQQSLLAYTEELQETTAARERMESELAIAHAIQLSLVPRTFPPFPDRKEFDLFAMLDPAKEVGGDFYDFFMVDPGRMLVAVGDVSGKGVPAALFMAVTRTFIRAFAKDGIGPGEILARLNGEISADNDSCMFVTVFCAIIDLESGEFSYASGGHNPPFLVRNGVVDFLPKGIGPLIGPMAGVSFEEKTGVLRVGDALFMYTDGFTEALNTDHELLGDRLAASWLKEAGVLPGRDMVDRIRENIRDFARGTEQSDDITLMVFRFKG